MKKLLALVAIGLAALMGLILWRAATLAPSPVSGPVSRPAGTPTDDLAMAGRLGGAVRIRTISHQDPAADDPSGMRRLHEYLAITYPGVYAHLQAETIGNGLLFTWRGSDAAAAPIVLLGHMDVVPISPGTEKDWSHAPFGGEIDGGFVWGRGTLDDKSAVLGLLEAAEALQKSGFQPERSVYLAFGGDEEVGGLRGAKLIAQTLLRRGVKAEYVLDEGGVIANGLVDGIAEPAALIGIAEKGYMSVELSVEVAGGHSSAPPQKTAIGTLSRAVAELEAHPLPQGIRGAVRSTLVALAPNMTFSRRLVIANLWLFDRLLTKIMAGTDVGRASLGTTLATTIFQSGDKDNVLPGKARAVINLRLLPGDTVDGVLAYLTEVIADPDVKLTVMPGAKPASSLSDPQSKAFQGVVNAVRGSYGGTLTAPFLTIGGTDSVHYEVLSPNVFRFHPAHFGPDDVARFHGTNERIGVADYGDCVRFYYNLIRTTAVL